MGMTVDEAQAAYDRELASRAAQHRYVAQAQQEVAGRMRVLLMKEYEVAFAKANLDRALGREGVVYPNRRAYLDTVETIRQEQRAALGLTDEEADR